MKKLWKTVQAWFLLFVRPILEWMQKHYLIYEGSSRPEVFCWKGILKYFTKFTGKHLCQSLFFYKVAGRQPVNFVKLLRIPFLQNTFGRLLLKQMILVFKLAEKTNPTKKSADNLLTLSYFLSKLKILFKKNNRSELYRVSCHWSFLHGVIKFSQPDSTLVN